MTFLVIIITFIIISFFGYVAHWFLHQPIAGRFYQSHMNHHLIQYPPENFSSDEYRSAGKDNTFFFFAWASLPILAIPIVLWFLGILSPIFVILSVAQMLLMGLANDYFHNQTHLNNSWIFKFPIGRFWRKLHRIHHQNQKKNFGIYLFWVDKIFKTYKS